MRFGTADSPIGVLLLGASDDGLTQLYMPPHTQLPAQSPADDLVLGATREQLAAYFAGELVEFDLPLDLAGSPHQQAVWRLLRTIAYGTTTSYKALADRLGTPGASRAVGSANSRNPVSIVVPCHRVIGSDGSLTGYAGGVPNKRWLLSHELAHSGAALF